MPARKTVSIRIVLLVLLCYSMSGCHSSERAAEQYYQAGLKQKTQQAFAQAAQQFRLALQQHPQHIQAHIELGVLLCRKGDYQQAIEQFLFAQEYGDNSYKLFSLMGYAYERLGKLDEAERFYQQAIERASRLVDVRLRLADVFEQQGKPQNAADVLEEILTIKPKLESAEVIQARVSFLRSPENPDAHLAMADMYIRHEQIARGLVEYRKGSGFNPEDPDSVMKFGIFCLEREQFLTALEYFQKAKALGCTEQLKLRTGLGITYEELERFEEAIQEYRAALHIDSEWYELHVKIAELLIKVEKTVEAANELEHLFHASRYSDRLTLGTGNFPGVNQLWAHILDLRGETLRKAVVQLKPSRRSLLIDARVNQQTPVTLRVEKTADYTIYRRHWWISFIFSLRHAQVK